MENWRDKAYQTLRKSEGFFKTDMVYLTTGGFWLAIGHGAAMVSGFLLSITFANFFSKESFGIYKFVFSVAGILATFSLSGMGSAITQSVASGFGNSLRRGFQVNLKWSLGVLLGALVLSAYYYINGNIVLSVAFLIVGVASPIVLSANLYSAFLTGKKDFRRSSLYGIINNTAPTVVLIATILLTDNVVILIIAYFITAILISFLLYRATRHAYQNEGEEIDPELGTFSGHLSIMDIISTAAFHLDKIIVFHYLGAAPLAIYAFAIAPVEQLQGGKKILSMMVMPKLSERPIEEIRKSAPRKALILIIYAILLSGAYIIFVPYFYHFFYPEYLESIFYSQVYSLTLIAIAGTIFSETLVAHKMKKELYIHRMTIPILRIVLFISLWSLFGLMGLVVTHIIAKVSSNLLSYYLVNHPLKT